MIAVFTKRGNLETNTKRITCQAEGRDQGDGSTSQGGAKTPANYLKLYEWGGSQKEPTLPVPSP